MHAVGNRIFTQKLQQIISQLFFELPDATIRLVAMPGCFLGVFPGHQITDDFSVPMIVAAKKLLPHPTALDADMEGHRHFQRASQPTVFSPARACKAASSIPENSIMMTSIGRISSGET
jgi:hypothetical protein